jgi:hypothetical protein
MEAIVERCCGQDYGQASVVACLLVGGESESAEGGEVVRRADARAHRVTRVVAVGRLHPRGYGEHWSLLGAGVREPRGALRMGGGQRAAHEERARAKDGRERL